MKEGGKVQSHDDNIQKQEKNSRQTTTKITDENDRRKDQQA
jgi:hypothetical protein